MQKKKYKNTAPSKGHTMNIFYQFKFFRQIKQAAVQLWKLMDIKRP